MADPRALNAFLRRFLEDQAGGKVQSLGTYQALFPEEREAIAELLGRYGPKDDAIAREAPPSIPRGLPARIGPYAIASELGRGGQGVVYLAEDERLHRRVALKVLTGLGPLEPDRVARFLREAEVAARLDHPRIATV